MTNAALYERVSTEAQVEKYGLGAQDWALKKRAEEKRYVPVPDGAKEAFVDDRFSGAGLDRPALSRLSRAVADHRIDVVLCHDPDRLSRSLSDLLLLSDEFARRGVKLEFLTQETDASPEGRMFFAMRGAVAEYERAKTRARTIRGRLQKARKGLVVSRAAAPYGYRYDPETSTLLVHEAESGVVRMVFDLYTRESLSLVQLADRLNRLGVARNRGGQRWHISLLGRMLCNETYAGTLWPNHWARQSAPSPGIGPKPRSMRLPREQQIATPVPAIVGRDMFAAAQKRLEENRRLASRNTRREYLLSGLLRHVCGSAMGGRSSHDTSFYYCFKSQHFKAPINQRGEPQPCFCRPVEARRLEEVVWDRVTGLLKRPEMLIEEMERLTQPGSATIEGLQSELAQVSKRLKDLPMEERRLVEGYRKGFYADFMMREEAERIRKEQASCEEKRCELQRELAAIVEAAAYKTKLEDFARSLSQGLDAMTFAQRREVLRLLVDQIIYDEGRITIKTSIPFDADQHQLPPLPQRVGRG
ncbi:MAG: recombinase family protein [Chloroflexi bacterium]|nr:recombinase family protein [Chloroflexota bacterium]